MIKLIEELEFDIYDCKMQLGDAGDNTDNIDDAISTLNKLKELASTNTNIVWCAQLFYKDYARDLEIPDGRARVWYGESAKTQINNWLNEFTKLNEFEEIEHTDFNDRLFVKSGRNNKIYPIQHIEIYELQSDHFKHNCTDNRKSE